MTDEYIFAKISTDSRHAATREFPKPETALGEKRTIECVTMGGRPVLLTLEAKRYKTHKTFCYSWAFFSARYADEEKIYYA